MPNLLDAYSQVAKAKLPIQELITANSVIDMLLINMGRSQIDDEGFELLGLDNMLAHVLSTRLMA